MDIQDMLKIYHEKESDTVKNDPDCFRIACLNGHLEVAKWLCSLEPTKTDVNMENVFREACSKKL